MSLLATGSKSWLSIFALIFKIGQLWQWRWKKWDLRQWSSNSWIALKMNSWKWDKNSTRNFKLSWKALLESRSRKISPNLRLRNQISRWATSSIHDKSQTQHHPIMPAVLANRSRTLEWNRNATKRKIRLLPATRRHIKMKPRSPISKLPLGMLQDCRIWIRSTVNSSRWKILKSSFVSTWVWSHPLSANIHSTKNIYPNPQGTHCSADGVHKEYDREGYENAYWNLGKTFAGVKILSKIKAIGVKTDLPDSNLSDEKRTIAIEFQKFYIISIYIVNAGRGLPNLPKRLAFNDAFYAYVRKLDKKKPVIIAGNMNISQKEVENHIGFTQEGRDKFTNSLSFGFMNDFRKLYPDQASAFTFWSYLGGAPSRNVGWRLDYFMVSQRFMKHVKDSVIRSEVLGSDHCPIILMLKT